MSDEASASATPNVSGFTKRDLGSTLLFLTGLAIQFFGNSPVAVAGAFVGCGLCVLAEAIAGRPLIGKAP